MLVLVGMPTLQSTYSIIIRIPYISRTIHVIMKNKHYQVPRLKYLMFLNGLLERNAKLANFRRARVFSHRVVLRSTRCFSISEKNSAIFFSVCFVFAAMCDFFRVSESPSKDFKRGKMRRKIM